MSSSKYSNSSSKFQNTHKNGHIEVNHSRAQPSNKSSIYDNIVEDYYENDFIKEPSLKPLENSYYGVEEIENKIKNKKQPLFKECFDVEKEVISL